MARSDHKRDHHGNPDDLEAFIARMEEPARADWQKPDEVIDALHLKRGDSVCDIGAGTGYFSLRAARAVHAEGRVWAVDVVPRMLEVLRQRIQAAHLRNVTPVLALDGDPLLPDATCDVALVIDTHHHFPDAAAYLRRLARTLKKGGRIVEIDYHKRELPVGPDPEHKVAREQVLRDAEAAGLVLAGELTFLPYQYFLVFKAPR